MNWRNTRTRVAPPWVILGPTDAELAVAIGARRRRDARAAGMVEHLGDNPNPELNEAVGAGAEIAAAAWLAVPYVEPPVGANPDVAGFEVKGTALVGGRMILHNSTRDDVPVVLFRGRPPRFMAVGWLERARHGKHDRFWRPGDGRPAYFVDDDELRDAGELLGTGDTISTALAVFPGAYFDDRFNEPADPRPTIPNPQS